MKKVCTHPRNRMKSWCGTWYPVKILWNENTVGVSRVFLDKGEGGAFQMFTKEHKLNWIDCQRGGRDQIIQKCLVRRMWKAPDNKSGSQWPLKYTTHKSVSNKMSLNATYPPSAIDDGVNNSLGSMMEYSSMFMMLSNDDLLALISFFIRHIS